MRFEKIVPDSARPDLVEQGQLNGHAQDAAVQKLFTPELLAEIEAADAEIDAGNYITPQQLVEHFEQKTAAYNTAPTLTVTP